jgi:hypothetical protein
MTMTQESRFNNIYDEPRLQTIVTNSNIDRSETGLLNS